MPPAYVVPGLLTAPGGISLVALVEDEAAALVGFVQLQGDGELQAHVSLLMVKPEHRLRSAARLLLGRALRDSGCVPAVFVEDDDAAAVYGRMPHQEGYGFRLQPFGT